MTTLARAEAPSVLARLRTWWIILRISLEERLAYRGDFALGTLMRFLPIITQIFLWMAVFGAVGRRNVLGYEYEDVVAYYLLTMIVRAFSSMPGLATGVAEQVRSGEIKKYLVQPIDLVSFLLLQRIAHKLAYYFVATLPFALVFFLCRGFFREGWPSAEIVAAFLISVVLSFLLGFFLEICLGLISFWFLEISSLMFVYMLLNFFLSGHMFPLDFLPEPWRTVVDVLPLKYLAYFPAAVFLGKVPPDRVWIEVGIEAAWTLVFLVGSRVLLARGVRQYSAFGG